MILTCGEWKGFLGIMGVIVLLFAWLTLAHGRDFGQYEQADPLIRQWFQSLMQPDNPVMSCCGEADAFQADSYETSGSDYVAIITDGRGIIPNGTKLHIPANKVQWKMGNPTGHGIVFIGPGWQLYCYVPPGGV